MMLEFESRGRAGGRERGGEEKVGRVASVRHYILKETETFIGFEGPQAVPTCPSAY
jgi:hypothetical protein